MQVNKLWFWQLLYWLIIISIVNAIIIDFLEQRMCHSHYPRIQIILALLRSTDSLSSLKVSEIALIICNDFDTSGSECSLVLDSRRVP